MLIACPHCHTTNRLPPERLNEAPTCGSCAKPILNGVLALDSAAFAELMADAPLPVLVDFWAGWCGPCRSFAPTFAAAAARHGGKLIFAKVDTEAEQSLAGQLNIRSIPTLVVFQGGQELGRVAGALPPAQLDMVIQQVLQQASA